MEKLSIFGLGNDKQPRPHIYVAFLFITYANHANYFKLTMNVQI